MSLIDDIDDISDAVLHLEEENERLKRSVDTLIEQLGQLTTENENLRQTLSASMQEWDGVIKEQQDEIKRLMAHPIIENRFVTNAQLEDITRLLNLLQPDIERQEKIRYDEGSHVPQVITAYRQIRPGRVADALSTGQES